VRQFARLEDKMHLFTESDAFAETLARSIQGANQ
jgi:hypothetical protein